MGAHGAGAGARRAGFFAGGGAGLGAGFLTAAGLCAGGFRFGANVGLVTFAGLRVRSLAFGPRAADTFGRDGLVGRLVVTEPRALSTRGFPLVAIGAGRFGVLATVLLLVGFAFGLAFVWVGVAAFRWPTLAVAFGDPVVRALLPACDVGALRAPADRAFGLSLDVALRRLREVAMRNNRDAVRTANELHLQQRARVFTGLPACVLGSQNPVGDTAHPTSPEAFNGEPSERTAETIPRSSCFQVCSTPQ